MHHRASGYALEIDPEAIDSRRFEELLKRVKTIEMTGRPERLRSNFFNGIKRMPVRVTR